MQIPMCIAIIKFPLGKLCLAEQGSDIQTDWCDDAQIKYHWFEFYWVKILITTAKLGASFILAHLRVPFR